MIATPKRLAFAEYLSYTAGSDIKYELVNGELMPMALPTGRHGEIVDRTYHLISRQIERQQQSLIVRQGMIGVRCPRGVDLDTVRIPDVLVMQQTDWVTLQNKSAVIDFDLPAPLLVVEVVSPSTKMTDYRAKRTEYAARDIPEYWIVDPLDMKITVLTNSDGWFDPQEFTDDHLIQSPTFPELNFTPAQMLSQSNL
ncbi:Uncharacterized protein conserved in cyanobacteria [Gloeomargarita lithophora Alchichica-D10]|uniref:Uncharacterized protein conserved in cyanobacteria n=1 Tax=Gloeomargarita lithophora Alchichica-D10 TaxID=1188229 RepID=A0A1J0AF90_9CYAN|nr:Uma2 family endonuclease [Gloeomargarita lithophora]APB34575.1 Uncharacterized protein conserved in cyanobacteria [Gloeomargarita lithophora Alchichica-D10]